MGSFGKAEIKGRGKGILDQLKKRVQSLRTYTASLIKGIDILAAGSPKRGIHISYGHESIPNSGTIAYGGIVKFQRLLHYFPNVTRRYNILYMLSSNFPKDAHKLCRLAKWKDAKFVWNQDGVCYPAWMPSGWKTANKNMDRLLHEADYVFYQSRFSKFSSDHFLGKKNGPYEILYNAVETDVFSPLPGKMENEPQAPILLTAGSKYFFDRIETPIRTLYLVKKKYPRSRLVFAGLIHEHLLKQTKNLISELNLEKEITLLPPFTQANAPDIYRNCDILIHPKINDPCPGVVIEAMACGLPIVYSESGGTPELVGRNAGQGIPTESDWDRFVQPKPESWAEAVITVFENLGRYRAAARARAVERFDLNQWVKKHVEVFTSILEEGRDQCRK